MTDVRDLGDARQPEFRRLEPGERVVDGRVLYSSAWLSDERHTDDSPCVGQWCCGCPTHPIGKPWGWNFQAWGDHYRDAHDRALAEREDERLSSARLAAVPGRDAPAPRAPDVTAWLDEGTLTEGDHGSSEPQLFPGNAARLAAPSVSVLGYRFRGLHAVSEGEPQAEVPTRGHTAESVSAPAQNEAPSPSERLTPILLTDDDLAWLAAYVGEQPYGHEPAQRIYRLLSRTLTELAVMDAGRQA